MPIVNIKIFAISIITYEYNQGSFLKHFLNQGTIIVIENINPKAPNTEKPILTVGKPEVRIVSISINKPNGIKHKQIIKGNTMTTNQNIATRFDNTFFSVFFIAVPP